MANKFNPKEEVEKIVKAFQDTQKSFMPDYMLSVRCAEVCLNYMRLARINIPMERIDEMREALKEL